MIFQKKIIIGSIMSFIATAVGIIAVFFPDLLNLQKERMDKLDIFISTYEDVDKLTHFLYKNSGKVVDLNVAYCLEHKDDSPPLVKISKNKLIIQPYYQIDGGSVRPVIEVISDKNNTSPAYSWVLGLSGYPSKSVELCKADGPYIYRGEWLSGIFISEIQSFNAYQYLIELEPLNKKDLKLKNY